MHYVLQSLRVKLPNLAGKEKRRLLSNEDVNSANSAICKQVRLTSERAGKVIDVDDEQIVVSASTIKRILQVQVRLIFFRGLTNFCII